MSEGDLARTWRPADKWWARHDDWRDRLWWLGNGGLRWQVFRTKTRIPCVPDALVDGHARLISKAVSDIFIFIITSVLIRLLPWCSLLQYTYIKNLSWSELQRKKYTRMLYKWSLLYANSTAMSVKEVGTYFPHHASVQQSLQSEAIHVHSISELYLLLLVIKVSLWTG